MAEVGMRSGRRKRTGGVAAVTLVAAVGLLSGACSSGGSEGGEREHRRRPRRRPRPVDDDHLDGPARPLRRRPRRPPRPPRTSSTSPSTTTPKPPPLTSSIPAPPAGLTLQQEAGQRIIYSYQGLTPPQHLLDLIRQGDAAGVIFFGGNISSQSQIAGVIKQLRQAQAASPVHLPLLLMTDQEGGIVKRLPGPPFNSAKQIGAELEPGAAATAPGRGGRPEHVRRRHEPEPGAGPRRLPHPRQLPRRRPALLQPEPEHGVPAGLGLPHRAAEHRRGGDRQALPRASARPRTAPTPTSTR